MFSAALGLIGGVGSIISAGYQYQLGMEELALKRKALKDQKEFGQLQYGMALDEIRKQDEQREYIKEQNERNQLAQSLERSKIEAQRRQRLAAYQEERDYVVNRQVEIDRAQAEQFALELEAYLQNRDLAKSERETAMAYLEEAKATARGERDEDIRRLRMEQITAAQERDFAIAEMRGAQQIAAAERADDISYRDRIIGELGSMQDRLFEAYSQMDPIQAPSGFSEAELMDTIGRYEANAVANVDRAADRVASIAEAGLIRGGMANSTAGTAERGRIAQRLALDYDNARLAARQQAMDYIQGKEDLKSIDFERRMGARGSTFSEIQNLYAPIVDALSRERRTLSANDYQTPVGIGTANVGRQLVTANQYASPLAVNSAAIAPTGMSSRMGNTLNLPSIAEAYVTTGDYNQFQPQLWNIDGPANYMANASQLIQTAGHHDPMPFLEMAGQTSAAGFKAIGGALNDLQRSGFGRRSSAGSASGSTGMSASGLNYPIPQPRPGTNPFSMAQFGYRQ